jgi:hypothetical protein
MADFVNFFKSGQVRRPDGSVTNLTDIFTKELPATLKKIPPPPPVPVIKFNIDKNTKDFFTTGTTDALKKSNAAIKDGFDRSGVVNFFEKDVKNTLVDGFDTVKQTFKFPKLMTDLMTNVLSSANTPLLLPIIGIAGFAIIANKI